MIEPGTYPIRRPLEVTITVASISAGEQLTETVICLACGCPVVRVLWTIHNATGRPCDGAGHL